MLWVDRVQIKSRCFETIAKRTSVVNTARFSFVGTGHCKFWLNRWQMHQLEMRRSRASGSGTYREPRGLKTMQIRSQASKDLLGRVLPEIWLQYHSGIMREAHTRRSPQEPDGKLDRGVRVAHALPGILPTTGRGPYCICRSMT